jgi:hypothetical protein
MQSCSGGHWRRWLSVCRQQGGSCSRLLGAGWQMLRRVLARMQHRLTAPALHVGAPHCTWSCCRLIRWARLACMCTLRTWVSILNGPPHSCAGPGLWAPRQRLPSALVARAAHRRALWARHPPQRRQQDVCGSPLEHQQRAPLQELFAAVHGGVSAHHRHHGALALRGLLPQRLLLACRGSRPVQHQLPAPGRT